MDVWTLNRVSLFLLAGCSEPFSGYGPTLQTLSRSWLNECLLVQRPVRTPLEELWAHFLLFQIRLKPENAFILILYNTIILHFSYTLLCSKKKMSKWETKQVLIILKRQSPYETVQMLLELVKSLLSECKYHPWTERKTETKCERGKNDLKTLWNRN